MLIEFQSYYIVIVINEFRTSQICPRCKHRLYDVKKRLPSGKLEYIRGLKWCASTNKECRKSPLWNRDQLGARNIYLKSLADHDPIYDRPIGS